MIEEKICVNPQNPRSTQKKSAKNRALPIEIV